LKIGFREGSFFLAYFHQKRRLICWEGVFFMGISVFEAIPKNIGYFIITAISFGAMCASTMFGVSMMTAAQQQTPPNLLGKIMAVIIAVSSCSQPVGQAGDRQSGVADETLPDAEFVRTVGGDDADAARADFNFIDTAVFAFYGKDAAFGFFV
jgi:hypothetical protein